jgi:PHD/YefM family antitoxin component YafN of YafNO toxin-antitoxin module
MKAIEVTGTVDDKGNVCLDKPVEITAHSRIRAIILYSEEFSVLEEEPELYDTPLEDIKASLRRSLSDAKSGQRIPIAQMWDGIDG